MEDNNLVKDFVQAYYRAQKSLDENNVPDARKQYYVLLDLYSKLSKNIDDEFQKELAYDQLNKIFNGIKEARTETKIPLNMIIAGVIIIVLSIVVALNPGIVGLAAFQDELVQPVNLVFEDTAVTSISLKKEPLSLAVSGEFNGESAKIFLEHSGKLVLLFDSSQVDSDGKFNKVCVDTCKLTDFKGNEVKLFIEVKNGVLKLDDLVYYVKRTENNPPQWIGGDKEFVIKGRTEIDLSSLFRDPEGDELVYLSTTEDGLNLIIENDKLIITPRENAEGEKKITLIASDMGKLTKVPITLKIEK
jgi:hypothetical protein